MKRLFPVLSLALGLAACERNPTGGRENLTIGQVLTINVNADSVCTSPINRQVRVVALSEHSAVLADVSNPPNGFTDSEYQQFADEFERISWPVVTNNFGMPSDVDRNGRILMLFTSAVNELTPRSADFIVGGFFYGRDLFPRKKNKDADGCGSSNVRELFYLLAPDPTGSINGNVRSKNYVQTSTFSTLSHEFEHLVNASRRLYVNDAEDFEETWLDEGLAHIAEELSFYAAAPGLGPRQNIALTSAFFSDPARLAALNRYQTPNFGRVTEYYKSPSANSPIQPDDDLATRGAAWQFLRYAADQRGGGERDFWFNLANAKTRGIVNLAAQLGTDPLPVFQNWGVAIYTDDAVPAVPVAYTHPSWHFRQILTNPALGGFQLDVDTLLNGVPRRVDLAATGNAYLRFGVLPAIRAEVRTSGGGATGGGACTTVQLPSLGQVYQASGAAASSLCLEGGTTGAEYVMIPFYASTGGGEFAVVTVTATGIVRPVGGPNPVLSPGGPTLARAAAEAASQGASGGDGGFERRLRMRERRELRHLFAHGPSYNTLPNAAAPELRISIVRTR
jgi:hypothetical protein